MRQSILDGDVVDEENAQPESYVPQVKEEWPRFKFNVRKIRVSTPRTGFTAHLKSESGQPSQVIMIELDSDDDDDDPEILDEIVPQTQDSCRARPTLSPDRESQVSDVSNEFDDAFVDEQELPAKNEPPPSQPNSLVNSQLPPQTPTTSRPREQLATPSTIASNVDTPGTTNITFTKKYTAKRACGPPRDARGRIIPQEVPLNVSAAAPHSGRVSKVKNVSPLPFVGGSSSRRKNSQPTAVRPAPTSPPVVDTQPRTITRVRQTARKSVARPIATALPGTVRKSVAQPVSSAAPQPRNRKAAKPQALSTMTLRQIQTKERLGYVVPRAAMLRIVKEISDEVAKERNYDTTYRWQSAAVDAIQEASEAYLTVLFEDANLAAIHAHRKTLSVSDVRLVQALRKETFREPLRPRDMV